MPSDFSLSDEKNSKSVESIKKLYVQIQKMPELTDQAKVIDQVLIDRLADLKKTASVVISQLNEQKKVILQRFDQWIMPIAQGVLDNLLKDAEDLKDKLDDKLIHCHELNSTEWDEQANRWIDLYAKWHDRQALIEKILEEVSARTKHLIDKDIQLIQDYQTQSLAHLPQIGETFKKLENRISQSIEEPLNQLMGLRYLNEKHHSIQQASEWIATIQEQRQTCFDQLLMKIDHVMKDNVHFDDKKDLSLFLEIEGELIFMERELEQIKEDLTKIDFTLESEKQFMLARLEGMLDHIEQLNEQALPQALQQRIKTLKKTISFAFSQLE